VTDTPPSSRERLRWLVRHTRILVLALVLLVIALAVASYSFGLFSSSSANPENTFTSGTMTQVNNRDDQAVLTAADLVPGSTASGKVTIRNAGDASGDFTLRAEDLTDQPGPGGGILSQALELEITQTAGDALVYDGTLAGFDSAGLGVWDPEEERTFTFTVRLGNVGNAYQESAASVTFTWDAVQAD
jgi:hypothetical protein